MYQLYLKNLKSQKNMCIKLYTDWSCLGNPWPGGYAALLMYWDHEKKIKWGEKQTTNNRMELLAMIKWLEAIKKTNIRVEVYTDSEYIYNWIYHYLPKWESKNWKTSSWNDVKNKDLWIQLKNQKERFKDIWFLKVEAHSDDALNNLVDIMARQEAKKFKN